MCQKLINSRLIVPRTIVVQPRLFVKLLGVEFYSTIGCTRHRTSKLASALVGTIVESIRRVPRIVAVGFPCGRRFPHKLQFIYEHFSERHILDMLGYLAIKVGDVTAATQMVEVVVELHLLIVVIRLEVTARSPCACHCPCLCRLRCTVVAAEALTIYIVVIVLTRIWQVKRFVVVFDRLQLLIVLVLVIDGQAICFIASIRYSSWVCLLCSPIYAASLIFLQIQS